jgi:gluconate 2-dehydrogenase gamma chain
MAQDTIPRRDFLKGAGAAGAGVAALASGLPRTADAAQAQPNAPANAQANTGAQAGAGRNAPHTWLVLTPGEVAFFTAAADTLIPADELSPSGSECDVPRFIDRKLASAWGGGAKMYRAGPFYKGLPEQGYQLALTPHQFFVAGVAAANEWSLKTYGKLFDLLPPETRVEALKAMESGKAEFNGFESKPFFDRLLTLAMEGFFSDPVYGGNRNKASWTMLGFPGLPATYADKMEEYRDKRYVAPSLSIVDFS